MSGGARISAVLTAIDPRARWTIGVVAKRTYVVEAGKLTEAPEQVGLVDSPVLSDDGLLLLHDTDLMLRRSMVDVVLNGHAYPHDNGHQCRVEIRVGELRRAIQVYGDRRVERDGSGHVRFTPPQRFERISLGWERAYGGYDAAALEAYGDPTAELRREANIDPGPHFGLYAYPRNPAGRGYLVELTSRAMELCRLPNLEEPTRPLRPDELVYGNSLAWPGGPPPTSTMWLPYSFFPRMTLLGFPPPLFDQVRFPPKDFHEVQLDLVPARSLAEDTHVATTHDLRGAQGAAPGMRAAAMAPGAPVELINAHPRSAAWRFPLAVKPPKMVIRLGTDAPQELGAILRTLLIEPDADRVSVVWVGESSIGLPLSPNQLAAIQHAVLWR
ncbi:DUF2169 domain-containing protein [Sorangium sp. So ce429]